MFTVTSEHIHFLCFIIFLFDFIFWFRVVDHLSAFERTLN